MTENIKNWIKVTRVQTAFVTVLALWAGHLTVSPLSVWSASLLGGIGILIHIWGFTFNEVHDAKYDHMYGDVEGHPISSGDIDIESAKIVAIFSGCMAMLFTIAFFDSVFAITLLIGSFVPGTVYNRFSKDHWWSNAYLSVWVFMLSMSAGAYAGDLNMETLVVSIALSIQIFVQVMEGDLKDISGPEHTFIEKLGAKYDSNRNIILYNRTTNTFVTFMKSVELMLIAYIIGVSSSSVDMLFLLWMFLISIFGSVYFITHDWWMVRHLDRDEIKKRSSIHEIVSILLIGISLMYYGFYSALAIMVCPVIWYVLVNNAVHVGALNPDI